MSFKFLSRSFYNFVLSLSPLSYLILLQAAKQQWQKTSKQMLESKKPFGLDLTPLQPSPTEEKKIVEIAMKFAFQIDSITLNLFTGKINREILGK